MSFKHTNLRTRFWYYLITAMEKSTNSVISLMNQFLRSVDDMDSTILVPHRLVDVPAIHLCGQDSKTVETTKMNEDNDLYNFYTMLLNTRNEILWGGQTTNNENPCPIAEQLKICNRALVELTNLAIQLKDRYEDGVRHGRNSPTTY